ncbi:MAG: hypothetical protein QMD36_01420 [Candidatus Aenigmarchaeota archaeon]|nr:hypothetical protein [Candidatus Aenigmarchaeota archaeon]
MKGIALETIAYFMIALATIVLIFTLIGTKITPAVKNAYCNFVRGIRLILPLPSFMKPPLPTYCEKNVTVYLETKFIETDDSERIKFLIASYVIACWEKTGKPDVGQNILCYELVLKRKPDIPGVSKDDVNSTLVSEDYQDILDWKTDDPITDVKSIGISYNSTSKKIEVV